MEEPTDRIKDAEVEEEAFRSIRMEEFFLKANWEWKNTTSASHIPPGPPARRIHFWSKELERQPIPRLIQLLLFSSLPLSRYQCLLPQDRLRSL